MALLSVTAIQLLMALVIFLCGFLSSTAPLVVANRNEVLFSAGNMLAAGVLLAAGLVHQLADSTEALADAGKDKFPWSYTLCGATFIVFLILEESLHILLAEKHHGRSHPADCHGMTTSQPAVGSGPTTALACTVDTYGACSHSHNHNHEKEEAPAKEEESEETAAKHPSSTMDIQPPHRMSALSITVFGEPRETIHHHHDDHIAEHLHGSLVAALMLLVALSVHSFLAGLSVGIVDTADEIYSTAVAIVVHKVFAGYALGSTMAAGDLSVVRCIVLATVFSLSTPTGILVGMGLSSFDEESFAVGIVQAMVAGTFLYVSIMEVATKELLMCRHSDQEHLPVPLSIKQVEALKLLSMLAGFCGMAALALYI